jgi:hypothetical protein
MKPFKPLAIAALSIAMFTPAKADENYLGLVDFRLLDRPIACRNLDDAIEASKLDRKSVPPRPLPIPFVAFVQRHQAGSTTGTGRLPGSTITWSYRIPPKDDCRFADADQDGSLQVAADVKLTAPNLPPGTIAICVTTAFLAPGARYPACGESFTSNGNTYVSYWIVVEPRMLMRSFDLPKTE